jgi:hypothetical protein
MEVSGRLHTPTALPQGEGTPGTYWIAAWVGPIAGLNGVEKNLLLPEGIEPRFLGRPTRKF